MPSALAIEIDYFFCFANDAMGGLYQVSENAAECHSNQVEQEKRDNEDNWHVSDARLFLSSIDDANHHASKNRCK